MSSMVDGDKRISTISPLAWRGWASGPSFDSGPRHVGDAIVQQWAGSAAVMSQPPLDHHCIVLHEGGPKRVHRAQGSRTQSFDVPLNACTIIEAESSQRWTTVGPIAFAHVYVRPDRFGQTVAQTFDRDPAANLLEGRVGPTDPLVTALLRTLIHDTIAGGDELAGQTYLEALLVRLFVTNGRAGETGARVVLPPHAIRRVRDFVRANLAQPISLDDLAGIAGYSRYHFTRAFRDATGTPPYTYVLRERIALARSLLDAGDLPIDAIARACGFTTHAQFSTRFKQIAGVTPSQFRQRQRRGA